MFSGKCPHRKREGNASAHSKSHLRYGAKILYIFGIRLCISKFCIVITYVTEKNRIKVHFKNLAIMIIFKRLFHKTVDLAKCMTCPISK